MNMLQKERVQQIDTPSRDGFDAIFQASFLDDIPEAVNKWGSSKVLLVASKTLAAQTDNISKLQEAFGSKLVHTHLGVGTHSPYRDVRDIAKQIQHHQADCVISVGSCSYSDATKIACLLASNLKADFEIEDMEALVDKERGFADTAWKPRYCKLILVPTSLSASEWNAVSSATNSQGKKQHFGSWDEGMADLVVLDPELAITSPEVLWLSSGVRCVDHCVETMCNPKAGEKGLEGVNTHAMKGLECMITGLTDYKKAKDLNDSSAAAREALKKGISECQHGSREALTPLLIWKVPMGPSHAIGHQLGSVADVMHGITSCILLAPVLRWQAAHLPDPHYKQAQAKILDLFNKTLGWSEESAADAIEKFVGSIGLPTKLKDVNVTSEEQIRKVADRAMTDIWGGQKRQMEFEDIMEVLNSAR